MSDILKAMAAAAKPKAVPAPAPAPAPAPKAVPTLKPEAKSFYYVRCGQDWAYFEASNGFEAEDKFNQHFGFSGTDHPYETRQASEIPTVWHSGQ